MSGGKIVLYLLLVNVPLFAYELWDFICRENIMLYELEKDGFYSEM